MNCPCNKCGIYECDSFLTQIRKIRKIQNKVNSLSDAREFYDPESENSSGATIVPGQTPTILCPRTLPALRFWIAA